MTDYRRELVELYEQYNPAKLKDVNRLLITFKGREAVMLDTLRRKYILQAPPTAAPPSEERSALSAPPALAPSNAARAGTIVARRADVDTPVQRMAELVAHMTSVDLDALVQHVASLVPTEPVRSRWQSSSRTSSSPDEAELFAHTLKFMQFFATCAKEFVTLAQREQASKAQSSPTRTREPAVQTRAPSPPPRACDEAAAPTAPITRTQASHSPPASRARTKTPLSASPDRSPPALLADAPPPVRPREPSEPTRTSARAIEPPARRTVTVSPAARGEGSTSVLETMAGLLPLRAGDTLLLKPGHYTENFTFADAGRLVLRAAYPGTPVIVHTLHPTEPALRIKGAEAEVVVSGLVFVGDRPAPQSSDALASTAAAHATQYTADASLPAVPLVAASHGAQVSLDGCHFYHCGTAAVTAVGTQTRIQARLCLVSLCAFAGVYAHRGGTIELVKSRVKCCEVGVRAAGDGSVLQLCETTVENCATDGIVLHQASAAQMTRSSLFNNKGNGALVAARASLEVVDSTIELNVLYGVQRFRGSYLHLTNSFIRDNGLLPINNSDE